MTSQEDSEDSAAEVVHRLPPVRRAFSAILPPNLFDTSMSSDASFDQGQT